VNYPIFLFHLAATDSRHIKILPTVLIFLNSHQLYSWGMFFLVSCLHCYGEPAGLDMAGLFFG